MNTPIKALPPMFAGTVMAATRCTYDQAVEAIAAHMRDFGVEGWGLLADVDFDGLVRAAIHECGGETTPRVKITNH